MVRRRGSSLIVVLLVTLILFCLGVGLLSKRTLQYKGSYQSTLAVQARALARAGLEDVRTKLQHDYRFVPQSDDNAKHFQYTEEVRQVGGGNSVGFYTVDVDLSLQSPPFSVLRVTSVGTAGTMLNPSARAKMYGEIGLDSTRDGTAYYEYLQVIDLGGF